MIILIAFAFLAGIVTVLSPCILPILPIVLSGSVTSGKRRPLGIVVGFIASFTFFTLFLSSIVRATGISPDVVRNISVLIVGLFGLSLLIPQVQVWIEGLFSRFAARGALQGQRDGFGGGFLVGVSLGLVWTPCVGPILASVITLALTGSVTGSAALITLAYSLGTAIPMLGIVYGGRTLLQKVPWLVRNTGIIQKAFGVLMIIISLAIYFNYDRKFQAFILNQFPNYGLGLTSLEDNNAVRAQLDQMHDVLPPSVSDKKLGTPLREYFHPLISQNFGPAPELIQGGEWLNSEPLTLASLRGKVILVDFWTYTCINCIRTFPYLKAWHEKYADKGLVIIGVHTPEFEFEKNPKNLQKAIADYSLTYPIMQDNEYATWRAYRNRYWPAHYFIDRNGHIRRTHFGEGSYDESEEAIQALLEETGASVDDTPLTAQDYTIDARTHETYLGYARMDSLSSPEPVLPDALRMYTMPAELPLHTFALSGGWSVDSERAMPSADASLALRFEAKNVFLVMGPVDGTEARVRILLDGQEITDERAGDDVVNGIVTLTQDRLYSLVQLADPGIHTLVLEFLDGNAALFAFTFG